MSPRSLRASRVALRALVDPASLVAIVVLLVNDHLLKGHFPGVVTGKMSDIAGLVFFPLLLAVAFGLVVASPYRAIWVSVGVTSAWFAAMKLFAPIAAATESLAEIFVARSQIVVDPWDLLALPAVLLAVQIHRRAASNPVRLWNRMHLRRTAQIGVLGLAAMASVASSCDEWDGITNVSADADGLAHPGAARDYYDWTLLSDDGLETLDINANIDPSKDERHSEACLPDGNCFRIDGGPYVLESLDGVTWTRSWEVPDGRLIFLERQGDSCDPYEVRSWDITITTGPEPVVLVAMGDDGLLRRPPNGDWERDVTGIAAPMATAGDNIEGELAVSVALALLLLLTAVLLAKARFDSNKKVQLGRWPVLGLYSVGATIPILVAAGASRGFGLVVLALVTPVTGFLGLSGLAATWSRLKAGVPQIPRRLALITSVVSLAAGGVVAALFYAWSAATIPHWRVAFYVSVAVGFVAFIGVIAAVERSAKGPPVVTDPPTRTGERRPENAAGDSLTETDRSVGRQGPWLAALAIWLATSIQPGLLSVTGALAMAIGTYWAARLSGHMRPMSRMFLAVPLGLLGVLLAELVGPALPAAALAVPSIKAPNRVALFVRGIAIVFANGVGRLVWPGLGIGGATLVRFPLDTWVVLGLRFAALVPFLIVAADRFAEWWVRNK